MDLTFESDDLELDGIIVTSMRDSVGLPESAASGAIANVVNPAISCSCNSCSGSSSCCCIN